VSGDFAHVTIDGEPHTFGQGRAWSARDMLSAVGMDPELYYLVKGKLVRGGVSEQMDYHGHDIVLFEDGDAFWTIYTGPCVNQ
jgi:hypothetical protein